MSRKNIITSVLIIGSFTFVLLGNFQVAQAGGPTSCNVGCGDLVPTGGTCGSGGVAMVCKGDPQGTGYCQGDPCNNWNCSLCGSAANGGPYQNAPTGDLCGWANHLVGSVTANGNNWTWQCQENPFGSPVINCSAPKVTRAATVVNGVCGSANSGNFSTKPGSNLCSAGQASTVSGSGPWTWTCNGSNGGSNATCQANPVIAAACGTRSVAYQATDSSWPANTSFCVTGSATPADPNFPAQGGTTTWSCTGLNDGANATCQATRGTVDEPKKPDEPKKEKKDDCNGTIGDYVWLDVNSDGVQDAGENGLSNITLRLKNAQGKEIDKTNTNSKGKYKFEDLCAGTYSVYVSDGDVSTYIQTFDPDGNKNNKTDAHLKGNSDDYKKADFGYNKVRTTPATGTGNAAIYLAGLLPLSGLWIYRKKLGLGLNKKLF